MWWNLIEHIHFKLPYGISMTSSPDDITRLFRSCEPNEVLKPDDPRYVNCDDVRGENHVARYVRSIQRAEPTRPQVKLFTGHRGVGKSSELLRIKAELEKPSSTSKPFKVIYIDTSDQLDLNDLDFPDLLVFIAAEVQKQLKDAAIPGFSPVNTYLKNVWDDIKGVFLSDVQLTEAGIDTGYLSLTTELKNRPGSRGKLREAIEQQSTRLLDGVNDLFDIATVKLRETGYEGVVLIVDSLEKVVLRKLEDGTTTHDRLFLDRSEQLASFRAHTIYTVPISLFYTPRCAQMVQTLGEHDVPVPMIRLHERSSPDVSPSSPGMMKMKEILDARCRHARVDCRNVFDDERTRDYLCEMTGGHPRHLLMFIQSALNMLDSLPITRAAAQKAVGNYANSLLRQVPEEYWGKLRVFDTPQSDIPKDEMYLEMLFLLHVFEYMNGQPWYEINPVIRTIPRFREAN